VAPAGWIRDALGDAFRLLQAGRPEAAGELCRRILSAQPDIAEAHFLVGLVALELKDRANAIRAFGSVTTLEPAHTAAWAQLAKLYNLAGQPLRCDAALEQAMRHDDGNPFVHDVLGSVFGQLGDQPAALGWYAKAVVGAPANPAFRVNFANTLTFLGRLGEAESELRTVLSAHPGNPNAHWLLAGLRRAADRSHVEEMRKLLRHGRYPNRAAAFLQYAIGKELEDLGDWDGAYEAFAAGAAARRRTIEFDESAEAAMYAMLERTFTTGWEQQGEGTDDPSPVFVVGQPRTGTTLVERILTAHSAVHSAGELRQFGNAYRRLVDYAGPQRHAPELFDVAGRTLEYRRLGEMYLGAVRHLRGNTPRFVDKLPSNYLYLPLILKALPNARIVHLRRGPMDACFASFKQLFADAYPHSYEQAEMARHHVRYYRLMQAWRERFGERYFEIDYERIAADIEPHARALIDFLGLPWEDACLDFHRQDTAVTTASAVQVREPAHTRSIGRWRRYERQLAPMRTALEAAGVPLELP
jgi:tetratricopeptide (TPR) repeat protein